MCMKTFFVYVIAWDEYGNGTREGEGERGKEPWSKTTKYSINNTL